MGSTRHTGSVGAECHRFAGCEQRFELNDEMQAIGEPSGFSESTGRLSGAYQRPGLSGEDDVPRRKFYGHSMLMVFFPWFLDTLSGLGIFDLRFSSMNCCNSVVSIISVDLLFLAFYHLCFLAFLFGSSVPVGCTYSH